MSVDECVQKKHKECTQETGLILSLKPSLCPLSRHSDVSLTGQLTIQLLTSLLLYLKLYEALYNRSKKLEGLKINIQ